MLGIIKNHFRQRESLYTGAFLFKISETLPIYIISTFLAGYVGAKHVGLYFTISYLILMLLINVVPNFFAKNGILRASLIFIGLCGLSLLSLAYGSNINLIIAAFIIFNISGVLIWLTLDILLQRNTLKLFTGRIRGIYDTFISLGLFVSPLLTGYLSDHYGLRFVFAMAAWILIPLALILILNFKFHERHRAQKKYHFFKMLREVSKDRDLMIINFAALLINIFYTAMVIYVPIYLTQTIGLSWTQLGLVFTVMLLPFVLFSFPAGWASDHFHTDREILSLGLLIIAASTAAISFYTGANPIIWMIILFMTRAGAAVAGEITEACFFRKIEASNIDRINFFRNLPNLAYIFGPILASLFLQFYPLRLLFAAIGGLMLTGIIATIQLKRIGAEKNILKIQPKA